MGAVLVTPILAVLGLVLLAWRPEVFIVYAVIVGAALFFVHAASRRAWRILGRIAFYLLLVVIVFYTVFPFYWAIVSSLKSGSALFTVDFIPHHPAWQNYVAIFKEQPVGRNILN
jgi:ABC-type glycerol-3-phosphate transport system permease component